MSTPIDGTGNLHYSRPARQFHWITAVIVFAMVPVGLYMVDRGKATDFDAVTNTLYSYHKLTGFILLWIVAARLAYRLLKGAPADEPTLKPWEKAISHLTHWAIYALLLAVPLLGWLGVSYFDARGTPLGELPALAGKDEASAKTVFMVHKFAAILLALLALMHVGAAMYHHFIRKDGVLRRMMPGLNRRS